MQKGIAHLLLLIIIIVPILVAGEIFYLGKIKSSNTAKTVIDKSPASARDLQETESKSNILSQTSQSTTYNTYFPKENSPTVYFPKENSPTVYNNYNYYSNQPLGFEFKYSKDLTVKEDSEEEFNIRGNGQFRKNFKGYVGYEPGKFLGAVVVLDNSKSYDTNPFTVWVFENSDNLTIDAWHHKYWYYPFVWGDFTSLGKYDLAPNKETTISGIIGKSRVIDYKEGKPKFIYVSKDQKMYLFRIIGDDGEKILSTLEIL